MSAIVELRRDLMKWRVSHDEFSRLSGVKPSEFRDLLKGGGELSSGMSRAWRELRESREVSEVDELPAEEEEVVDDGPTRRCVVGRRVPNGRLLMLLFSDGSEGRMLKKPSFRPKPGMELEVAALEDEGFWKLVGKYRPNGVRLG